jgi:hypothetical protein
MLEEIIVYPMAHGFTSLSGGHLVAGLREKGL